MLLIGESNHNTSPCEAVASRVTEPLPHIEAGLLSIIDTV